MRIELKLENLVEGDLIEIELKVKRLYRDYQSCPRYRGRRCEFEDHNLTYPPYLHWHVEKSKETKGPYQFTKQSEDSRRIKNIHGIDNDGHIVSIATEVISQEYRHKITRVRILNQNA